MSTVGISGAVGTILGASTLPFYGEPGKHLINIAIGAGVGIVVGAGVYGYTALFGANEKHAEFSDPGLQKFATAMEGAPVWAPVLSYNW